AREHFEFRRMEPAAPGEILDAGKRRRRLLRFDRPRGVVAQAADEFEAEADRADGRPLPVLPPGGGTLRRSSSDFRAEASSAPTGAGAPDSASGTFLSSQRQFQPEVCTSSGRTSTPWRSASLIRVAGW